MGIRSDLLSVIFPPECHICGDRIEGDMRFICSFCRDSLPLTNYHQVRFNPMERRLLPFSHIERATGLFFYTPDTPVASLVQDFKYRHFPTLARECGRIIGRELADTGFFTGVDCLMPVPLFIMKKLRRGYNQTELIARGIGDITGIPVARGLKSVRPHSTQTGLDHEERHRNVKGIFRLNNPEKYAGKHIMLVDDICTTGSTLSSAASAVTDAQPVSLVSAVTFAVTHE